jgi:hypothetical protein
LTDEELELLREAARDHGRIVVITVTGCAYACCGRGWRRRDGYEQVYRGYIDNLEEPEHPGQRLVFMLYAAGIGTLSYVVAVGADEVVAVEPVEP